LRQDFVSALMEAFCKKVRESDFTAGNEVKSIFKEVGKETGIKGKDLFMTIRIAATGQMHGPDVNSTLALLGKEKVLKRLQKHVKA